MRLEQLQWSPSTAQICLWTPCCEVEAPGLAPRRKKAQHWAYHSSHSQGPHSCCCEQHCEGRPAARMAPSAGLMHTDLWTCLRPKLTHARTRQRGLYSSSALKPCASTQAMMQAAQACTLLHLAPHPLYPSATRRQAK